MKLYNSLTRKKDEFIPIEPGVVKMYSCGPTVYNYFHIGNARPFIIFDILRKYLEYQGYKVLFAQNFTDIDDKMINKANDEGITVNELAEKFIKEYYTDAKGLGVGAATYHPRATENIEAIIETISKLVDKNFAYEAGGDVYFDTKKFEAYGKLSHQNVDDLELGSRIDVDEKKRDAMDFVLWKGKKENEPFWQSPWGEGRPGWHIECSAMATKYLGETIDIHSGGQDLIFPHHENEIAQSEAANGKPFANYWLHNGFINVNNEKMSKSLGNFFTVRDIVKTFDYEVLRFFMISAHYRSPINFSKELLEQSKNGLERLYNCIENLEHFSKNSIDKDFLNPVEITLKDKLEVLKNKFISSLDDDLNTADALASIFEMVKEINTDITANSSSSTEIINYSLNLIKELGSVLGILNKKKDENLDSQIESLINERQEARKNKNFKRSDEIRDLLKAQGIILEDTAQGVKWKRV